MAPRSTEGPCVRCFDSHPALVIVHIMVGLEVYALSLCNEQATKLQTEQMRWARYGIPVAMPVNPRMRADEPMAPVTHQQRLKRPGLPINYERWKLTAHARQRQGERGLSEAQILWCAEHPDTRTQGRTPDTMVYKQGSVRIVVKPETYEIVTVIDRESIDASA